MIILVVSCYWERDPPQPQSVYNLLLYSILNSLLKNSDVVLVTSFSFLEHLGFHEKHDQLLGPETGTFRHIARIFVRNIRMGAIFGDGIVGAGVVRGWLQFRNHETMEPFKLEKAKNVPVGPQNHEHVEARRGDWKNSVG